MSFCFYIISDRLRHPKAKHFLILLKFFIFNVLLVSLDIGSDVGTAVNFYNRGHSYWGSLTLLFIFMPFFARILVFLLNVSKCFSCNKTSKFYMKADETKLKIQRQEFSKLMWHIPLLHPVRYFTTY